MDIDQHSFRKHALKILHEISESHFVAFDFEFSGVARSRGREKQSLQEYYTDVKQAAEKYQILQVGFTIVQQDTRRARYVARPYNFNISPLTFLHERDFSREWTYQGGGA
jgi:poly(A)-specific ribonuclease